MTMLFKAIRQDYITYGGCSQSRCLSLPKLEVRRRQSNQQREWVANESEGHLGEQNISPRSNEENTSKREWVFVANRGWV